MCARYLYMSRGGGKGVVIEIRVAFLVGCTLGGLRSRSLWGWAVADKRARGKQLLLDLVGTSYMEAPSQRRPVRAAFALAGAGSLGTFLAGALRELVIAIRAHNEAIAEERVDPNDPRILHPEWGRVSIDAVGGSSAGALCSGQLVKALYDPSYLGIGQDIDTIGTVAGDWIEYACFEHLAPEGREALNSGHVEAPGWTLLSASKLYDVAMNALRDDAGDSPAADDAGSPLPRNGIVGVGITLTDVMGYHEHADFEACQVLGHPQFGAVDPVVPHFRSLRGKEVRDLGVRKHSEIRRLFVGKNQESRQVIQRFLDHTERRGQAMGYLWTEAQERLASLAAASAALPLALGPMALTDTTETGGSIRRLYMDGGVLNNKPISPALTMARWQDEIRVLSRTPYEADNFDSEVVDAELDYERVCFFIDAFPDRTRGAWRSPHPDIALTGERVPQTSPESVSARDQRIDDALETPSKGLGMFFESMLTSLRAQDIRGVSETNFRVARREEFIRSLVHVTHHGRPEFYLTDFSHLHAYSAVRNATRAYSLTEDETLAMANIVYEVDKFSRLRGRRTVTMIPVFAPENLVEVLAGESLYAVGGLLSREARLHDAKAGQRVARNVLNALPRVPKHQTVPLERTPEEALPNDAAPLVERLIVSIEALIQGDGTGSSVSRGLVTFPFRFNPLVRLLRTRLTRSIRGTPTDDGGGR